MADHVPNPVHAARRAKARMAMIFSGLVDLALAGFFLAFGRSLVGLEEQAAWMIAGLLAAIGVVTLFVALFVFGRKDRAGLDKREDEPVIRR